MSVPVKKRPAVACSRDMPTNHRHEHAVCGARSRNTVQSVKNLGTDTLSPDMHLLRTAYQQQDRHYRFQVLRTQGVSGRSHCMGWLQDRETPG
jgi:hypothetical protein